MSALGSIVVRKQVAPSLPFDERDERDFSTANATPSSAEQFPFRISGPGPMQGYGDAFPYEFSLYGSDQRYFNDLQAGTYTIEELDNGGLETSIECYNQFRRKELVSPEPIVTIASGMTVDVELAAGQSLDCVFTNTDPARAIISVEKDVAPGYNDPTDFTFTIEGPESFTETFVLDDDNLSSFVEARRIFDSLMPGDYKITEEQIAGYVTAVTCYEVSSFGNFSPQLRFERIGAPFVDPIATSTNGIVEFSIEGGETVFCDFVNRVADATLIVVKDDTGDTGTDVPITVTERGVVIATGIVSDNGTATTLEVPIIAGFGFTLTETVPVGFTADATSTTCVDQDGTSIIREDSDIMYYLEVLATPESAEAAPTEFTAHVFGPDVQPGDTVTCTLVNDPMPGSITVTKVSDTADGTDFSFALSGPASDSFVLDDDDDATVSNTKTISNLAVGTYTLVETAPGYTTEIVCVDPDSGTTTAGATATIDLDAAESISCTYTNTKITTGTIVIVSDTAPDGPQDFTFTTTSPASNTATALPPGIVSFAAGFTLDDDGDETTMPRTVTFTDLDGGVHTVTGIAGGTTVSDLTATIDLDATEVVTCTFTHTANTGDGGAVGQILPSPADDEPIVDTASPAAAATTGAVVTTGGLAVTGSESAPVAQIALATVGIGLSVIAAARTRRRLF